MTGAQVSFVSRYTYCDSDFLSAKDSRNADNKTHTFLIKHPPSYMLDLYAGSETLRGEGVAPRPVTSRAYHSESDAVQDSFVAPSVPRLYIQ